MRAFSLIAALCLALVLPAGPAPRAETPAPAGDATPLTSLLFTATEVALIEEALRAAAAEAPAAGPGALYLSGILYLGPRAWTVWLNGERVTPDRWPEHVEGLTVERDSIEVKLGFTDGRSPVSIRLRPNQTYIVATGEVVEGALSAPVVAPPLTVP